MLLVILVASLRLAYQSVKAFDEIEAFGSTNVTFRPSENCRKVPSCCEDRDVKVKSLKLRSREIIDLARASRRAWRTFYPHFQFALQDDSPPSVVSKIALPTLDTKQRCHQRRRLSALRKRTSSWAHKSEKVRFQVWTQWQQHGKCRC